MSDENYWCMHVWLDLFFIIKATCNSCACFGWDTQACIQAIVTRGVSSEWISKSRTKYNYLYQNRGTKSKMFFPYPWVGEPHLDHGFISQMFILKQFSSENDSCLFDWLQLLVHKPIQLILYFLLSWQHINFDCLSDQLLVHNSLQCLWVVNLDGTKYQQNCQ